MCIKCYINITSTFAKIYIFYIVDLTSFLPFLQITNMWTMNLINVFCFALFASVPDLCYESMKILFKITFTYFVSRLPVLKIE